jgi:DNA modification methylase
MMVLDQVVGDLRKRPEPTQIMDGIPTPHRAARSARLDASAESAPPRDDAPTPTSPPEQGAPLAFPVEMVPVGDLHPDPENARRMAEEGLEALEKAMRQLGWAQPIVARPDGTIIDGHHRLTVALRLGYEVVPVVRMDLSIEKGRLLGLALNQIGGSWDEALLARELAKLQMVPDLDLSVSGFDQDQVAALLRSLDVREKRDRIEAFDLDDALDGARQSLRTKAGDLWQLGDHRLLCGDATDPAAVERLLAGATPRLLVTDPPYGVALDLTWRDRASGSPDPAARRSRSAGHRNTELAGDTRVDWSEAFTLVPTLEVGYVWHAGVHAAQVAAGLERIGFEIVSQVIWDKGAFTLGRAWYHWGHEPCWVVRTKRARLPFRGPRDQATIWRAPSPKMPSAGSTEPVLDHPTQKPLLLFETPIRNHLKPGEAVYDPFVGSGTCLIAAERCGMRAFAMELDPVYVEVALRRWERFSGHAAVRIDD